MKPYPPQDLLHEYFDSQAGRTPEDVAVIEGDRHLSYRELGDCTDHLASALRAEGIGAGSTVGLHMERSINWVACILGILKANAAVVPLPPGYPPVRLSRILDHAELDGILTKDGAVLPSSVPGRVFHLDQLLDAPGGPAGFQEGDPAQPALILSSSGSTGRPKMIVRSHRSFFHRLRWTWEQHPYGKEERCCQKSHMTTTHAIYELFEPLLQGVPVVMISDDDVRDLERFWDILRAREITRLLIVPSQLQASMAMPGFAPPGLRVMVLMGEYVSPGLAKQALEAFPPPVRLYSIYGSTEASSTLVCDLREDFRVGNELPLGRPIQPEVEVRVLAADGAAAGPGQVGRLHLGGPPLFSGYYRDEERTNAALVSLPPSNDPFYDTGDQVRVTPGGEIEFVGRADHTVKVRGFRVDLQEVERALLLHPGIRQAVVMAGKDGMGTQSLRAFVSPSGLDRSALFETLRDHLPDYMIPSQLTELDRFPLTASGKVDRQTLLAMEITGPARQEDRRDLSGAEERVARVWTHLLGRDAFPPDASFFEVGGTSLTVLSMVNLLRKEFGLTREDMGAHAVYQWPTIGGLARHIEDLKSGAAVTAHPAEPILVTLKRGSDAGKPPLFLVSSAGGALGSYDRLTRALNTDREIIGVRDPFLWGGRDPSKGFDHWVDIYLHAIRERQASGPYFIVAYSSAGAFGYEVARRIRSAGEEVGLLALIDPLGMDRRNRWRFGWWVLRSTYGRPHIRWLTRLAGWALPGLMKRVRSLEALAGPETPVSSPEDTVELAEGAARHRQHVISFSALLELNTGIPCALDSSELDAVPPEEWLSHLLDRVRASTPDADLQHIERVFRQYPMQVRAQNAYHLKPYDGRVFLAEPATRYGGLIHAQLKPYVKDLEATKIRLGKPTPRVREMAEILGALGSHYRSMRDEGFVTGLARELDARLR